MLDTLPTELLELLFGYLCVNDRLQLSMVSKRMYNVFWQSPVGANLRKGIKLHICWIRDFQDLVNSRICQMKAINEVVLTGDYVMDHVTWDLLAPQLISLTIKHDKPQDIFRLLKNCSRLVTLNWTYDPRGRDRESWNMSPADPPVNAVRLPRLRHLDFCMNIRRAVFKKIFQTFLFTATTKSRLITLKMKPVPYFDVLLRHVTRHAASLKSLSISGSDITREELVTLGSVPDLQLLDLDISSCEKIDLGSFVQFLRLQPNLESLNLNGCEDTILAEESWNTFKNEFAFYLSGLRSINVGSSSTSKFSDFIPQLSHLQHLIYLPGSMEAPLAPSLNMSSCNLRKAEFSIREVLPLKVDHLRNLRELKLYKDGMLDRPKHDEVFARIWQHCSNLEILKISGLTFDADGSTAVSCNNLRKLTDLTVKLQMPNEWTDSLGILLKLPNLRRVYITFSDYMLSIEDFLTFLRHLAIEARLLERLTCGCLSMYDAGRIKKEDLLKLWPRLRYDFYLF